MIGILSLALAEVSRAENSAGAPGVWGDIVHGVWLRVAVFSGVLAIVAAMGVFALKAGLA